MPDSVYLTFDEHPKIKHSAAIIVQDTIVIMTSSFEIWIFVW